MGPAMVRDLSIAKGPVIAGNLSISGGSVIAGNLSIARGPGNGGASAESIRNHAISDGTDGFR